MKLYKFRNFDSFEFTLDIIMNERLYCADYSQLNDPFEGLFSLIEYKPKEKFVNDLARPLVRPLARKIEEDELVANFKSLDELPSIKAHPRVCSLTNCSSDIRMWSHYAASHTGLAIEIDIDEEEERLFKVDYSDELAKFLFEITDETPATKVLSYKTSHWEYEQEYRIINDEQYFSVNGKITGILLGARTKEVYKNMLTRLTPKQIPVFEMSLDRCKLSVVQGRQIN